MNECRMPGMLARLRDRLDDIARDNDREHRFVTGLLERFESGEKKRLSDRQFEKIAEIYHKYET